MFFSLLFQLLPIINFLVPLLLRSHVVVSLFNVTTQIRIYADSGMYS